MRQVTLNSVVAFRYIMKNDRGEVLENSMNGLPTLYLHGSGGILSCLQSQMEGLVAGNRTVVFLEKSSGLTDADYTFEIIIDAVRNALPEEILLGYPVQVLVEKCEEDCECYG
jgi:FKBP-type peptidyl-prolyl cis-trans isomerase 2